MNRRGELAECSPTFVGTDAPVQLRGWIDAKTKALTAERKAMSAQAAEHKPVFESTQHKRDVYAATECSICHNAVHEGFEVLLEEEWAVLRAYWAWRQAQREAKQQGFPSVYLKTLQTEDERLEFQRVMDKAEWRRVVDHDHWVNAEHYAAGGGAQEAKPDVRGAAHNKCNREFSELSETVPVLMHNFKGYDAHMLLLGQVQAAEVVEVGEDDDDDTEEADSKVKPGHIRVVALNTQQYMSIIINRACYKDSLQFMQCSLSDYIEQLKAGDDPSVFAVTRKLMGRRLAGVGIVPESPEGDRALELVMQKGVYPYMHVTEATLEQPCLPPIEAFFDPLTNTACKESDYVHARRVWDAFKCRTLRNYHDIYLHTDVSLLADCMTALREASLRSVGLDPLWYHGVPGLSYDSWLLKLEREWRATGERRGVQLLTDIDMFNMYRASMRGGLTVMNTMRPNNVHMGERYDPSLPTTTHLYLDMNSMYPTAMLKKLPCRGFKWAPDMARFAPGALCETIAAWAVDADEGGLMEVDFHWPADQELHDRIAGYPIAPHNAEIAHGKMSAYSRFQREKAYGSEEKAAVAMPFKGLVADIPREDAPRRNYVCDYRVVKRLLEMGAVVSAVHRVLLCEQDDVMADYVVELAARRGKAKTTAEGGLLKLIMNSLYGKTIEDVTRHGEFQLCPGGVSTTKYRRLFQNPRFAAHASFGADDRLCGAVMMPRKVLCDKPITLGMAILDLSKLDMAAFYYDAHVDT